MHIKNFFPYKCVCSNFSLKWLVMPECQHVSELHLGRKGILSSQHHLSLWDDVGSIVSRERVSLKRSLRREGQGLSIRLGFVLLPLNCLGSLAVVFLAHEIDAGNAFASINRASSTPGSMRLAHSS